VGYSTCARPVSKKASEDVRGEDGRNAPTIGKGNRKFEEATLPNGLLFAGNPAFPNLEIENTLCILLGAREESERVIFPPLLPIVRNG